VDSECIASNAEGSAQLSRVGGEVGRIAEDESAGVGRRALGAWSSGRLDPCSCLGCWKLPPE
jgi:hypothetical protein